MEKIVLLLFILIIVSGLILLFRIYHPTLRRIKHALGFPKRKIDREKRWEKLIRIISKAHSDIIRNGYHIRINKVKPKIWKVGSVNATILCGFGISVNIGVRHFVNKYGVVQNKRYCRITYPENLEAYIYMIRQWGTINDVSRLIGSRNFPDGESKRIILDRYKEYVLNGIL